MPAPERSGIWIWPLRPFWPIPLVRISMPDAKALFGAMLENTKAYLSMYPVDNGLEDNLFGPVYTYFNLFL